MGDNGIQKGKGGLQTCIKDPWTKPKGVRSRVGGRDGWDGGSRVGKMETTVLEQQ